MVTQLRHASHGARAPAPLCSICREPFAADARLPVHYGLKAAAEAQLQALVPAPVAAPVVDAPVANKARATLLLVRMSPSMLTQPDAQYSHLFPSFLFPTETR